MAAPFLNGATYHVTTPGQLEQYRLQQAAAREALVRRAIERSKQIAQQLGVKLPGARS